MKTIRSKMMAVVISASLVMMLVSFGVIYAVYIKGFSGVERQDVIRNLARVRNALGTELERLEGIGRDWAWWDDTYAFMEDGNREYLDSNVPLTIFEEQNLKFIIFLHPDGRVAAGRMANLKGGGFLPVKKEFVRQLAAGIPILVPSHDGRSTSGVMVLDGKALVVSAESILTSEQQGPSRGVLLMGREFDAALVSQLSRQAQVDLKVYVAGQDGVPDDIHYLAENPEFNTLTSADALMCVEVVRDMFGSPSVYMVLTLPRTIFALGMDVMRIHVVGVVLCVIVLAAVVIALLDSLVIARLGRLGWQVATITQEADYSGLVELSGEDELSRLASAINTMLAELRSHEDLFSEVLTQLNAGVVIVDEATLEVMEINPYALELMGHKKGQIVGRRCRNVFCPSRGESCPLMSEKGGADATVRKVRRADGEMISVLKTAGRVQWRGRTCILETLVDISELEDAQFALRETEKLYQTIFMNSGSASILIADDTTIILANQEFETLVGRPASEMEGKVSWTDIFHPDDVERMLVHHRERRNDPAGAPRMYETRIVAANGQVRTVSMTVAMVPGEKISVASLVDITDRKKAEEQLVRQAYYDELTGLANRRFLMERLDGILQTAERQQTLVGVFLLDLDNFKNVNDLMGHGSGDTVLRLVAERLKSTLRRKDILARVGGDEFLLIIDDAKNAETLAKVAMSINDRFAKPIHFKGKDFYLGFSIGISIYPDDGARTPEELVKNADMAMYQAKRTEQNSFCMFTPKLNEKALTRMTLEGALRQAIENKEFVVMYQPQVDLSTGVVAGAEALVRWRRDDGRMVSPADFIPLAEETGLIVPLDMLVLETAAAQAAEWRDDGMGDFKISVNLSARHFSGSNLADEISRVLEMTGLPPANLGVEITETLLMESVHSAVDVLGKLAGMGVQILLDDFGTGYSSLAYLSRLPIDILKIDRSFVMDISGGESDGDVVVRTILQLADSLRLKTVAEGVETVEQVAFLREHNCMFAQGYLFSKPVEAAEFKRLFTKQSIFPE